MDVDNMGTPEQLYPGDLEKKKMLARAQAEENAIRRAAIVNLAKQTLENKKLAYFQAGEKNPQEPTPGKPKYPVDKLQTDLREDGDKHMVGQKPFPGVGAVDGMHPSPASVKVNDEEKRKEMIQRASLRARFVKASNNDGTQNLGKSGWEVFLGDKLLLSASVNDLSGNRAGMLYESIATKDFGAKLIEKVKVLGADKVRSLVKSAAPEMGAPDMAAPAPEMGTPAPEMGTPAPDAGLAPEGAPAPEVVLEDPSVAVDKKDSALETAKEINNKTSDLVEILSALTDEQAEMGKEETAGSTTTASESRTLNVLRRELNGALIGAMKESLACLHDHQQELEMIVGMYDKGAVTASNKEFVGTIIDDALNEAKVANADAHKLMTAFVKYARGTQAIVKRAEIEAELESIANEGDSTMSSSQPADDLSAFDNADDELSAISDAIDGSLDDNSDMDNLNDLESLLPENNLPETNLADDNDAAGVITTENAQQATDVAQKMPDANIQVGKVASFDTSNGRAAMRAKLAADALKTSPHLHEAHPKGNATTDLDVKPTGDLAVVESLEEEHDAMMDLANAPPKVRKEAEAINRLVKEGKLDPADLDGLVSEGLDKDAVSYYRKYFGQVDGGSEFATELVKEHVKAEMEAELNKYRIKMARAYELAYDMVDRGLCHSDRNAVSSQVDEIMKVNDDSFETLKRVVAKHNPILHKEAGHMPQVGMIGSGEFAPASNNDDNLVAQLSAALSKTSKKMF